MGEEHLEPFFYDAVTFSPNIYTKLQLAFMFTTNMER